MQADLNASRKAQDKPTTLLLGTLISEVKNRRIELKRDPTDAEVVEVLRKGIKLADKERSEAAAIEKYLPAQVSDEELRAAVIAAIAGGATAIGAVMGKVLPQFKGRAEGATISAIAREELGKQG